MLQDLFFRTAGEVSSKRSVFKESAVFLLLNISNGSKPNLYTLLSQQLCCLHSQLKIFVGINLACIKQF